jgi:hypothetical protein
VLEFKGQLHIPVVVGHINPKEESHCDKLEHDIPYPFSVTLILKS